MCHAATEGAEKEGRAKRNDTWVIPYGGSGDSKYFVGRDLRVVPFVEYRFYLCVIRDRAEKTERHMGRSVRKKWG